MFVWCAVLFFLGLMAFLDSILNMGMIFRQVNSVFFMLVSLALLLRTSMKIRSGQIENYESRIQNLEQEIRSLKQGRKQLAEY